MIKFEQLTKKYLGEEVETTALNQISLQITQGDFVAIMGPSGCGKSTLLNVMGLLDTWDGGKYWFDDSLLNHRSEAWLAGFRKEHISFIFQNFNLLESLRVLENVEMPLLYRKMARAERRQLAMDTLRLMGLEHRANHYITRLSGGQQQRVAIARALVTQPRLLLADEPTGNLDSENGLHVMHLMKELNEKGHTIVMVTHSERDAAFAKRILRMHDGKLLNQQP